MMSRKHDKQLSFERDKDLLAVFDEVLKSHKYNTLSEVLEAITKHTAKRFYISSEYALNILSRMSKGDDLHYMYCNKQRMFTELYDRYNKLRLLCPNLKKCEAVELIVEQEAPCFYLTAGSINVSLSRIKKRIRLGRNNDNKRDNR